MLTRNIWEHQNDDFSLDRMFYASTTGKWPPTYSLAQNNRNNMQNNLFVKVIWFVFDSEYTWTTMNKYNK